MSLNPAPVMTSILVHAGVFSREPFVLVDIGARGGVKSHWRAFGDALRFVGFEPDPDEFRRLQSENTQHTKILPFGLGKSNEKRVLHIHRNASSSSLYVEDPVFLKRMLFNENYQKVAEQVIELRRLDDIAAEIGDIDFIDLDAEGAELEIMQAGTSALGRLDTLGLNTEVRFLEGLNTPVFWQTDRFMRDLGFSLYDLNFGRESRVALPYPMCIDQRDEKDFNIRIFGGTIGGQIAYGDALYLRDFVGASHVPKTTKVLKMACLFEIFGQNDSAAELILADKGRIDRLLDHRQLLDALVPIVSGKKLTYNDYIQRYFAFDPMLRPSVPSVRAVLLKSYLRLLKSYVELLLTDPKLFLVKLWKRVTGRRGGKKRTEVGFVRGRRTGC